MGGGVTVLFFLLLLYLGNIAEPNQNFSIFYFVFFSPSPNVGNQSHPLPLPSAPILHCHIPCFHFMLCVTNVIINTEYINNIYICIVLYLKSHIYFALGNSGSCLIPKSLEVEYVLYELASVTSDMCLLPHTCYKCFSMCIMNG